nr:ATP-binding protein [uncultured Desulfobulbus sp.]
MSHQPPPRIQSLRQRAEEILSQAADGGSFLELADFQTLLHELQVHQLELELQNEELRASQNNLELSRSHYMRLFHQAPAGYVVLDHSGLISEANATFSEMVGHDCSQLLHRPFTDFLPQQSATHFLARYRALLKKPKDKQIELQLCRCGGYPCHVNISIRPHQLFSENTSNQNAELFLTITDITERKEAEQALLASEQLAHSTINALTAHIAILDDQGTILYVNRSWQEFARLNGVVTEQVGKGVNYFSLCAEAKGEETKDAAAFAQGIRAVLRGEKNVYQQEYPCHSKNENRWFIGRVTRFKAGETYRIVVAHENITEQKKLDQENRLLQQRLHLVEKEESLSRMAGAIAHHFNNQLFAVMGNLELFLEGHTNTPEHPHLYSAMESLHNAAELSNRMLTYLGINNKGKTLLELSEEVRLLLTLLLARKPVHVQLIPSFPTTGPMLHANPEQLRELITNLVENSWEAMEAPGTISITLSTVDSTRIYAHFRLPLQWKPTQQDYACIEVSDTGSGMEPRELERIFDPFYSNKFLGRGMGLPLVLGIVRAHNGCITLKSQPQKGTRVRVYLPVEL